MLFFLFLHIYSHFPVSPTWSTHTMALDIHIFFHHFCFLYLQHFFFNSFLFLVSSTLIYCITLLASVCLPSDFHLFPNSMTHVIRSKPFQFFLKHSDLSLFFRLDNLMTFPLILTLVLYVQTLHLLSLRYSYPLP